MSMERYKKYKPSGIEWIGEVPEHWELVKTKYVTRLNTGNSLNAEQKAYYSEVSEDTPNRPYIASKDIDRDTEFIDYDNGIRIPLNEQSFEVAPANSSLLCIEGGSAGKKMGFVDREVCFVNKLCCFNSFGINPKYQYYFIMSKPFWEVFSQNIQGMIGGVSVGVLKDIKLPNPPEVEQEAIAAYLDARCADIDKVVATQEKRIALLKELKQSVITQAVTRGLNPDVKMKDSGVEWIGEVPEHWERISMKYFFYMKGRIGWQGLKADEFIDEGPYLITGTDFENGRVVWERCYHISQERYNQDPAIHVKRGDLLITKDGTVGKLALIDDMPDIASLNSHLLILRPYDANLITNNYVYWYLSSQIFKIYTGLTQSGSIMESLSQEKIGDFQMALPPIEEQKQIASYLDGRCADIDKQIEGVARQIELLREYKQSLITEVVTGKRKVC